MNTITPDGPLEQDEAGYVGTGPTQEHRQADAAVQELLDELEPSSLLRLAGYLTDHAIGFAASAIDWRSTHQEYADVRGRLVGLMLHHGWTPPVLHHEPLPASEQADHGTVQTWALAMRMRRAAGVEGHMTPLEELSWFQLAEQAVKIHSIYTNN